MFPLPARVMANFEKDSDYLSIYQENYLLDPGFFAVPPGYIKACRRPRKRLVVERLP